MRALMLSVLVIGCSGGSSDVADNVFRGTWQFDAGSMRTSPCAGFGADLSGTKFQIVTSTTSDFQMQDPNFNCMLQFEITGNTAVALPNNTCARAVGGSGCPVVSTFSNHSSLVLTLDEDTHVLTFEDTWNGAYGNSGCGAQMCNGVTTGTAHEVILPTSASR